MHVASDAHRGKPATLRQGVIRKKTSFYFLLDYNRWQKALASGEIKAWPAEVSHEMDEGIKDILNAFKERK